MLANSSLPDGPLYDPKSKVQKFRFEEDFDNIRFNLLGTNKLKLYSDPKFHYYLGKDKEWRRPKEIAVRPHFIKDKPSRFDALQGDIGDCWIVAAMEVLTLNDNLMKHVVPPDQSFEQNYIGAFHFRFWQLGNWYDVVVDDRLPVWKSNKRLCYVESTTRDVFWAALMEKAYAKLCGTTYGNLEGGYSITALQDFSGGIVEIVLTDDLPREFTIKWYFNNIMSNDALMCCGCFEEDVKTRTDLIPAHAYSVTNVFQSPHDDRLFLIRIMNPHGQTEWRGDWSDKSKRWKEIDLSIRKKLGVKSQNDGEFWMDDGDFTKFFKQLNICHLGPGQYEKSRRGENVGTWKTTTFFGIWKSNISSGGSSLLQRHINPQYRILLGKDDSNEDGMCSVVIELIQRDKFERRRIQQLGVYIYSLENITPPAPMPLDYNFFQTNDALNDKDVTFDITQTRSFVYRTKLSPGKYCLIPCTKLINVELQYLLRVYSESYVEMWEYEPRIAKLKMPLKEQSMKETDIEVKNVFQKLADSRGEVDWISLKEILDQAMYKSSYSAFARISKLFRNVYELFMTTSDDTVTDNLLFSKDECRSMIAMLDDNHNGKLNYSEFSSLWSKICFWTTVYKRHVDETEVGMAVSQLKEALSSIGYNVNIPILHVLINFYANEKQEISLKEFILCGVRLETAMLLYDKNNNERDKVTFTLEEWVKSTLML